MRTQGNVSTFLLRAHHLPQINSVIQDGVRRALTLGRQHLPFVSHSSDHRIAGRESCGLVRTALPLAWCAEGR